MTSKIHTAYSALHPEWPEFKIECGCEDSALWLIRRLKHNERYVIGDIQGNIVWVRYDAYGAIDDDLRGELDYTLTHAE